MKAFYTINQEGNESLYVPCNFIFYRKREPFLMKLKGTGNNSFSIANKFKLRGDGKSIGRMNELVREGKIVENDERYVRVVEVPDCDLNDFRRFYDECKSGRNVLFKVVEIFEDVIDKVETLDSQDFDDFYDGEGSE